jgi:hypothetical protein
VRPRQLSDVGLKLTSNCAATAPAAPRLATGTLTVVLGKLVAWPRRSSAAAAGRQTPATTARIARLRRAALHSAGTLGQSGEGARPRTASPLTPALSLDRSATVLKAGRSAGQEAAAGLRHSRAPVLAFKARTCSRLEPLNPVGTRSTASPTSAPQSGTQWNASLPVPVGRFMGRAGVRGENAPRRTTSALRPEASRISCSRGWRRSADFQSSVSRISNPQSLRPDCTLRLFQARLPFDGRPAGGRRYGRLETCATSRRPGTSSDTKVCLTHVDGGSPCRKTTLPP